MGLSVWHLVIILVIVLVLFGPSRLPALGKNLGEAIRGFKKGISDDEIDVTESSRKEQLRNSENQAANKQHESKKDKI
jgi:sec-independent protein translocase protein TatA